MPSAPADSSLLDTIVARLFPILDEISRHLDRVEEDVLERPQMQSLRAIRLAKRDLVMIRRIARPLRELMAQLQQQRHGCLSEFAQTYFRDMRDYCVQITELVETHREIASEVAEAYVSIISDRTSDIMKVLTIIGAIFNTPDLPRRRLRDETDLRSGPQALRRRVSLMMAMAAKGMTSPSPVAVSMSQPSSE